MAKVGIMIGPFTMMMMTMTITATRSGAAGAIVR
jgi:hypothetical protein